MKKWYESKTLWVNILALIAIVIQGLTGNAWFSPDMQGFALTLINIILRFITKHEINWKGEDQDVQM